MINDLKYIPLLCNRFRNFRKIDTQTWQMSCPICGDSRSNPSKARGYIFKYKNVMIYKCHRCGISMSFSRLLKSQDETLYRQYIREKFCNKRTKVSELDFNNKKPEFKVSVIPKGVIKLSELPKEHKARKYIEGRAVPNIHKLYYTDDFQGWVNTQIKGKFKKPFKEERVIIPFLNEDGTMFGFQGRSLDPNTKLRYITIMLDENSLKVYGKDDVDRAKTVYVTEGPIDSMFVDNAIAICGSDLTTVKGMYRDMVLVYDNEPRAPIIVKKIENAIDKGFKVVIWNKGNNLKDINDMVLEGINVNKLLKERTFKGIRAKLELTKWKKI